MVLWLRLCASAMEGTASIPGQGTKNLKVAAKNNNNNNDNNNNGDHIL